MTDSPALAISYVDHVEEALLSEAGTDRPEAVELTPENAARRRYPFIRDAYLYANKPPAQPLAPIVREFLAFGPCRDGQQTIAAAGYRRPLPERCPAGQLRKLD